MAEMVARMTNGPITVSFLLLVQTQSYGAGLKKDTWGPAVSGLRSSIMGGQLPYEPVQEQMTVHVAGVTTAEVLSRLNDLLLLLDQAARWSRGEPVGAVLFQYLPKDSALDPASPLTVPVYGQIKGQGQGGGSGLTLPPTFNTDLGLYVSRDINLRFHRGGLWVGPEVPIAWVGGAGIASPEPAVVSLSNNTIPAPTRVMLGPMRYPTGTSGQGDTLALPKGVLLIANGEDKIVPRSVGTDMLGGDVTSYSDAANLAYGEVGRFSSSSLGETQYSGLTSLVGHLNQNARRVDVWAVLKNNSATVDWVVKAEFYNGGGAPIQTSGKVVLNTTTDPDAAFPHVVPIGSASSGYPFTQLRLVVDFTPDVALETLDINYIVMLARDEESNRAITIANEVILPTGGDVSITVDPRYLEATVPFVALSDETDTDYHTLDYLGDAFIVHKGMVLAATYIATSPKVYILGLENNWRFADESGAAMIYELTAARALSYLLPL